MCDNEIIEIFLDFQIRKKYIYYVSQSNIEIKQKNRLQRKLS